MVASGLVKISYVKSAIGYSKRQKDTVKALGLRRIGDTVVQPDNPAIRGMVQSVGHLVTCEEVEEAKVVARKSKDRKSKERSSA